MSDLVSGDMLADLAAGVLDGGASDSTTNDTESQHEALVLPDGMERIAFGIWAFEAGEDMRLTQSLLMDRTGEQVPLEVLRSWRTAGRWPDCVGAVHQKLRVDGRSVVQRLFTVGTVKAARWLSTCFEDPGVSAAVKLKAAGMLLDRGGFPMLLRSEIFAGVEARGGDLAQLSDGELEAEWRAYIEDVAGITEPAQAEPSPITLGMADHEHARTTTTRYIRSQ